MKILIISSAFPPYVFGGAEVAAYNLARLLVARGHEVSVATSYERGSDFHYGTCVKEGYRLYHIDVQRTHTLFGRTATQGAPRKLVWHLQDYFDPRNAIGLRKILSIVRPDHIDVQNIMGLGYNVLNVLAEHSATVTYALHDYALACFRTTLHKNGSRCLRRCLLCKAIGDIRQYFLGSVSQLGFVSPSYSHLQELKSFVPLLERRPTLVLKNAPDEMFQEGIVQVIADPLKLIYVGRLEDVKGIEFLLDVLDGLSPVYDFHLSVLGTGSQEERLRRRFANANWVTFHGFVDRSYVREALSNANLYCMPSLWAETYGMTTAQSLKFGIPVFGSNTGGTKDLVRDKITGRLLQSGNKRDWRQAFCEIFENPQLLIKWNNNALRLSSEFSVSSIGRKYEMFIDSLKESDADGCRRHLVSC